jgi:hypothetical protein
MLPDKVKDTMDDEDDEIIVFQPRGPPKTMLCGHGAGEQRRLTAAHGGSDAEMDPAPVQNGIGKETQVEGEEGVSEYCGGDNGMVAPSDVIVLRR